MKPTNFFNPRYFPALSRREFLKFSGGCAALSSTPLLSSILNLAMTKSAVAAAGDLSGYKALVCVFLNGGNDSWNMLVPLETGEYADYAGIRNNLALPQSSLLPITDAFSQRPFGIHPGMPQIQSLYNRSVSPLAFVANVGSLVEPTDKAGFNTVARLPSGLFSHSDAVRQWQTSIPYSYDASTGWAGRMADIITDSVNDNPFVSMNIALNQTNILQVGRSVVPYVVGSDGPSAITGYRRTDPQGALLTKNVDTLFAGARYADLFEKTFADGNRNVIDASQAYAAATNPVTLATPFPNSTLGNQLKQVARAIAARNTLKQRRQIFFVTLGGWDHHDELLNNQAKMLPELSQALSAFYQSTVELGVDNDVVTFTASDFGRTLSSNGNGTDHGWGGNQIVMGSAVAGGRLYGEYPTSLRSGSDRDIGRGRLIPTTSVDEYSAELALWFGITNDTLLEQVLPNIRNFGFASGLPSGPLGFLS